jgi:hypothetical protein
MSSCQSRDVSTPGLREFEGLEEIAKGPPKTVVLPSRSDTQAFDRSVPGGSQGGWTLGTGNFETPGPRSEAERPQAQLAVQHKTVGTQKPSFTIQLARENAEEQQRCKPMTRDQSTNTHKNTTTNESPFIATAQGADLTARGLDSVGFNRRHDNNTSNVSMD